MIRSIMRFIGASSTALMLAFFSLVAVCASTALAAPSSSSAQIDTAQIAQDEPNVPASGQKKTGWVRDGDTWRYYAASGTMKKGWLFDGAWYYLDPSDGKMRTGKFSDGKSWYVSSSSGAMCANRWVKRSEGWYYAAPSGTLKNGWLALGGIWYYLSPDDHRMLVGKQSIGGATYFFAPSGAMRTGWSKESGAWYYYTSSGAMKKGWLFDGAWYYLDPSDGKMRTGKFSDGKAWYISGKSGAMHASRWVKRSEGWYYATSSGALKTGWLFDGGKWYWLDSTRDGLMLSNARKTISGKLYAFTSNGDMRANCQVRLENEKCGYAGSSGAISTIGTFDGERVILRDSAGQILIGWQRLAGKWFYADKNGVMQTGWVSSNGKWYWLKSDGTMAANAWVDGGKYYVGADGSWVQANIIKDFRAQFSHGSKPAKYQKYIVIHDTEGGGTPQNTVSGWASNGQRVASHFVIGKDGTIVQCVPLDRIAHHVGFAPRGSNARFGVPEDGRDDRKGTVSIGSYSPDYGMNSYSIGIELVHVGSSGEGYPAAQLNALDRVIAYIDSHYGFKSTIIDHKMWNGNSDTSREFAGYLANYRDHRTHY